MAWFADWFDSVYYHRLYSHRDEAEAARFLEKLVDGLGLKPPARLLDVGCGAGRHSATLHRMGFRVKGVDLSESSIAKARQTAGEGLTFEVADMRYLEYDSEFDTVLNLFTSFGYFDDRDTHQQVINRMAKSLRPGGSLVLDYLNAEYVEKKLVPRETIERDGTRFHIEREIKDRFVYKHIGFEAEGRQLRFTEKVCLFTRGDLTDFFTNAGLTPYMVWGNYRLEPYRPGETDRCIVVGER